MVSQPRVLTLTFKVLSCVLEISIFLRSEMEFHAFQVIRQGEVNDIVNHVQGQTLVNLVTWWK